MSKQTHLTSTVAFIVGIVFGLSIIILQRRNSVRPRELPVLPQNQQFQPAEPTSLNGLRSNHIMLRVPDFEETSLWYQNNLGFRQTRQNTYHFRASISPT